MAGPLPFIPYPPVERHGVVGDRRTAALVAADGTVDWFCLPCYDHPPVFGALLDAERGGHWRLGPAHPSLGRQRYLDGSAVLLTAWTDPVTGTELELLDAMAWPWDDRTATEGGADGRALIRRLRCLRGAAACSLRLEPRHDFGLAAGTTPVPGGLRLDVGGRVLGLWCSRPLRVEIGGASAAFTLGEGEEVWAVLGGGGAALDPAGWSAARARASTDAAVRYWHDRGAKLACGGGQAEQRLRRSALTIHLLGYAPTGAMVAAPTTSLPERIGGDRNWDYRYAWVRDASLSVEVLAELGDLEAGRCYLDWLADVCFSTAEPLQIAYRVDGGHELSAVERHDLHGYRGALPVRIGNDACGQHQLDSLGYLAACVLTYLECGGAWRDAYWDLVHHAAASTAAHWRRPDSGIWEMAEQQHFVSSKVMAWVALDRAAKIAARVGRGDHAEVEGWRATMAEIHAEVMNRGWSESLGAFRQRYEADSLDAAALLIPIMGFLPPDHPRVLATADRIAEQLTIDGLVHRYVPGDSPGKRDLPVGEFEGAFLPCTFWLATVYARAGRRREAAAILARAETAAGELGLFAEEVDARSGAALGNFPLLFAHAEHVRAVRALDAVCSHHDA